jgi:selenocysteine-specific elongation factor
MKVIGTAGHVDHGKSRLVHRLTGIDPDRLKEEQERQMTIDLGFAWMTLPGGESVGIIDVPGHRDFIENMLAGVGGIDAALFVVAADEGVMPQTREHLAILDLLEIQRGVVALAKVDLVEEKSWLDLVREEVFQLLQTTRLANAPIVPVSAVTGEGIDTLVDALEQVLTESPPRRDLRRPRLPIDRVFTISGFGTVVTGTLVDGVLEVGQEVEILPPGLKGRIRGLQTHKTKIKLALPGSRVAANLTGVEVRELTRGDVITIPNTYKKTRLVDVRFRLLPDAESPIRHDLQVKFFSGAAQQLARVRLLGVDQLRPGEDGWLQLVLDRPVVVARGDHFILRRPSPGATLGGGRVADPHPMRRHRRKDVLILKRLEYMLHGSPGEVLGQSLLALGPTSLRLAVEHAGLERESARKAIEEMHAKGEIIALGEGALEPTSETLVMGQAVWSDLKSRIVKELRSFHKANPLRIGMPREELKSRLRLNVKVFTAVLLAAAGEGEVIEPGIFVSLPEHEIVLDQSQRAQVESLLDRFEASPYSPPSVKECLQMVGNDLMVYLLESGQLIKVSADVVFEMQTYEELVASIGATLKEEGTITVAKVRDKFDTSRKYALALMEHLDSIGVTVREGDARRLAQHGGEASG